MEETTVGIRLKLESLYMTMSVTNQFLWKSNLHDVRLKEVRSLKSHFGEFDYIVMDLRNHDVSLDDEDLAIKFLCSLPKDFKHFRETVLYGKDVIVVEEVKGALLYREMIEKQLSKSDDLTQGREGLVVNRDKSRCKSRHKNVVCYNCKKKAT